MSDLTLYQALVTAGVWIVAGTAFLWLLGRDLPEDTKGAAPSKGDASSTDYPEQ